MSTVEVTTHRTDRHTTTLVVGVDGSAAATVVVSRSRRSLAASGVEPAVALAASPFDPAAWTDAAAASAAAGRWRDPHPAIRTVTELRLEPGPALAPAEVLEAVGAHLEDAGIRRLDLRVARHHALRTALIGDRWVQGPVGDDVVCSLSTGFPWASGVEPAARLQKYLAPLPRPVQRAVRKVSSVHPRQVPELVKTTATEIAAAVRMRYSPGSPRSKPAEGAPKGSYPFAASRYRTVRAALALVPAPLRTAPFIDIGCGDGRVLAEALAAGFPRVIGREFDPELAQRAQDLVGTSGHVDVGDALATPLPDDVQVVFLNNPFDSAVVARFAPMLTDTLERRPRPFLLLYLNPRPIQPVLDAGLVLVEVTPLFSVFTNRHAP